MITIQSTACTTHQKGMDQMDVVGTILILTFYSGRATGLPPKCETLVNGFTLPEDYDTNKPPFRSVNVSFSIFIFDISKVSTYLLLLVWFFTQISTYVERLYYSGG